MTAPKQETKIAAPLEEKKPSANEGYKLASKGLRGSLAAEMKNGQTGFSEEGVQLIKFHGFYQQYDRDRPAAPKDRVNTFMIRGRIPGGRLSTSQYLLWDRLADDIGGKTFRLTTRQSLQLHGLKKGDLRPALKAIWDSGHSTKGACGDVVRNVTQAVNPQGKSDLAQLDAVAQKLSDHFLWKSNGYAELWIDGEPVPGNPAEPEPDAIFGKTYLPRKFKIGVTLAGDNGIDLYTNDMGFAASLGSDGVINGYFVFAGGGLGMTHGNDSTYPRAADYLGWVKATSLIPVAEAIVTAHRDFGDRTDRKHARLKYVIAEKGVDWFRAEVETRSHVRFENRLLPAWKTPSYLGWHARSDGTMALGFHTLSGRIKDFPGRPLKSTVKELVAKYGLSVQVTADQDLILMGFPPSELPWVTVLLKQRNLNPEAPSRLFARSLACPALPTCSLAITEAERVLPEFLPKLNEVLVRLGLDNRAPVLRMTGCPNGCARSMSAEVGLVGQQGGGRYTLVLGGDPEGTRVGTPVMEKLKLEEAPAVLEKAMVAWKNHGRDGEAFGDFCFREMDLVKRVMGG